MRSFVTISALLAAALAAPTPQAGGNTGGSGPYSAQWTTDDGLPNHTIYAPVDAPEGAIPVLVWGNGACSGDGTGYAGFLLDIASYGFLVIASGAPGGTQTTVAQDMTDSISFAATLSGGASAYGNVDGDNVAAAGHSCGGLEAYAQVNEEAVKTIGIFNSGFYSSDGSIQGITKPTFYFLGGPEDIAYENGERDYAELQGVPKWIGNINIGHGGTYYEPDGGAYANAAVAWLQWVLQGSSEGASYFESGLDADGWTEVESDGLDQLPTGGTATTPSNGTSSAAPVMSSSAPVGSAPAVSAPAMSAPASSAPVMSTFAPVASSFVAPLPSSTAIPAGGDDSNCAIVYV